MPKGKLIFRTRDNPEQIYIFVRGKAPCYYIMGWLKGVYCKQPEFASNPGNKEPAWFVPADQLEDIDQLMNYDDAS